MVNVGDNGKISYVFIFHIIYRGRRSPTPDFDERLIYYPELFVVSIELAVDELVSDELDDDELSAATDDSLEELELATLDSDELLEDGGSDDPAEEVSDDDSEDELASLELELEVSLEEDDELSALDELASELDDELFETELADDAPNTALNCSSVTQVSPTQILFALTAPFSNDIPNIVLNLSKIQANKLSVPVPLEAAALACKSLTFKFNSCIALTKREVIFG